MPPKKRGRPRKSTDQTSQSNRPALSVNSNPPASSSSFSAQQSKRSSKERRTSKRMVEEDEQDELSELPSTVTVTSSAAAAAAPSPPASKQRKGTTTQTRRSPGAGRTTDKVAKPKTKKRSGADAELDAPPDDSQPGADSRKLKKFAHLKPRTRHISQSVITTKWKPAPLPAQHAARALFVAAKRPVVEAAGRRGAASGSGGGSAGAYDRRRAEAEATLASVLRKLEKQVPRIPFPGSLHQKRGPGGEVFELEKVVERNRALEAQLTPAVHAVKLLEEAVRREERVLEGERAQLGVLRQRARGAERVAKERGRRGLHPVLKRWRGGGAGNQRDEVEEIKLVRRGELGRVYGADDVGDDEELSADEELAPVLAQLRGHLDSMRANLEQVEGLDEAMTGARVALDCVLRKRVANEQYRGLVSSSS
ncbi:CENP-Q, a CENPA-CAD centromere complex subunit-domain-containing protein [Macrophomina phaseolina]|uniref:CENP-Q, a CENPA-CAD centromere complex subunit-domain-containing protein n=1 Tax=Macrophomina phaseolina TaxID=35725 RepID=A0ABQ8GRF4_9PEZI|nr:CENP-Q, a CENPA-CAD centromere complex subunit-domain-containing protein [Macrophomina phaseolina]